ncbi:MAG: protein kinase [Rhodobacterales bacterium]|nr:protein kinase [Rhodobacterales bacterium]
MLNFLDGTLAALAHAHAMQVIHRDVKPSNIVAFPTETNIVWKLADLGIAHALDHHDPDDRMMRSAGTPLYMAPEQLANRWRDLGPWTDLYSVGCLVWELITGSPPFAGGTLTEIVQGHLQRTLPTVGTHFPVPDHIEAWLQRLLQKRTSDRFIRVADAIAALHHTSTRPGTAPASWQRATSNIVRVPFSRRRALFGPRAVRLVRRETEQAELWQRLRHAQSTQTVQIVVLAGPGDVGQAHLAGWLMRRAHEMGASWMLWAQHSSPPQATDGLGTMVAELMRCVGMTGRPLEMRLTQILHDMDLDDQGLIPAVQGLIEGTSPLPMRIAILQAMLHVMCVGTPGDTTIERTAMLCLHDIQFGNDAFALVEACTTKPPVGFSGLILIPIDPDVLSPGQRAILTHPSVAWMQLAPIDVDTSEQPLDGLVVLRQSLKDPFWHAEPKNIAATDQQLREWLTHTLQDNGNAKTLWHVVSTAKRDEM